MADDAPFPLYGSTFSDQGEQPSDDIPFPLYGSTFGKETIRDPEMARAGTGLSGVPTQRGTWEDVAHYGAAGVHELGATGAGFMASVSGDTKDEAGWRQAALEQQQAAQESREQVTPTVEAGWRHPIMWAAEQAPGFAALAIPAAVATAATAPIGGIGGPALLGGVMAAQTRGDVYNRLTGEGIKPTSSQLATATEVGMAQGVATGLTGGLASKLPVSKLVGRALGITGDAGAFGAGAAGQEYTTQQAEIAAGQRDRVDPSAVGGAFVSGAEFGLGFGVPHLLGSGVHRNLAAKGGENASQQGRTSQQAAQEEAKARASAGGAGAPEDAADALRQPPSSPLADPTLAAGAKGEEIGALAAKINARKAQLGITPESNQQAEPVEVPPEVAQPAPPPAPTPSEAPPADIATGPPSPPPPAAEPAPAPGAAPAGEVVAPEPPSVIQAQHAALLDPEHPREAMVYNPGDTPLPLPDNTFGQTKLSGDGRIIQYRKDGPNKLTPQRVTAWAKSNKLNELLQLSPVNKDEAVRTAASVAGEEPAVVTTTTDTGDKVKVGAATTASVPGAVAMQEATKGPGETVQVETPEQTIGDRFAQARAENVAAQVTPESKPLTINEQLKARAAERAAQTQAAEQAAATERAARMEALKRDMNQQLATAPAPTDRVLRAEDTSEKAMQAAQAAAQEKVQGIVPEVEEAKKGKHWTAGELAKKENANKAANEIMQAERNHPKPGEQPNDILARAKGIVAEAKGIHVPTEISEEGKHGPGMMLLREAKDLIAKDLPKQNKFPSMADYARFLDRERMIREGRFGNAMEARRNEGKESVALGSPEEGGAEGVRPGGHEEEVSAEEEAIRKEEPEEKERAGAEETSKGVWRATVDGKVLGDSRGYKTRSEAQDEAEHIVKQQEIADRVRAEEKAIRKEGEAEDEPFTPESIETPKRTPEERAASQLAHDRDDYEHKKNWYEKVIANKNYGEKQQQQARDALARLNMDWESREQEARPQIEVKEGEHYTAPKAAAAFKVVKTRPKLQKETKALAVAEEAPAKLFEHMSVPEFREYMQSLHDSLPDGSVAKQGAKDQLGTIDRSAKWAGAEGKPNYPPPDARQNIVDHIRLEHNAEVRRKAEENPWKKVSEALTKPKGKYIGDDTPTATELKLRRAGWDEDEIRDFLDNSTPADIKEAVADAQTVAGERWGKAQEEKPEPEFDREFFRKSGLTEDEIDELEKLSKEPEEGLVGPDHYLTDKEVETLQVPNRRKDTDHVNMETSNGKWFSLKVRRNSNIRDMLTSIANEVRASSLITGEVAHDFLQRIITLVGDVPVRYIPKKELYRFAAADLGEAGRIIKPGGFYSWDTHQILIDDQPERHAWQVHVQFHEAIHAATSLALERFPEFKRQIRQIMDSAYWRENADQLGGTSYAFKDEHEFIAEIFSNQKLRDYLAKNNIPNDLKKQLVDLAEWRKQTGFKRAIKTMWDLTALLIGKVLKLPPRGVSYLEATLHLTEKYMEQHAKDVAAGVPIKFKPGGSNIEAGRYIRQPEEQVKTSAKGAQDATRKPWEFWKTELAKSIKSGTEEAGYKAFTKASNFDTLRIASEHLFGRRDDNNSFRRVQEGTAKMDQAIRTMLGEHDPLVQRVADMKKANPDGLDRIVTLLSESADYNVHPDHALGQGLNSYINPRSKQFDVTAGREHHEAILAHPRLSDEYNRSTPDEQKLFRDLRDELTVEGRKNAQAHYDSFSNALRYNFEKNEKLQDILGRSESTWTPAELKKVERYAAVTKVLDGDKLEGDEKEQFYNDPHITALRELKGLQKKEGPYMPSTRKGEWVVNGTHDVPKADNAISQKDNEAVFATLKDAYDYRKTLVDNSLPSTLETIKEPVTSEQGRGSGADTYRVTVQNKHSSAVESKYEGDRLAEALRAQGVKNVTNPMLREKNEHIDYGLHSGTIRAIDHAIDALTHLSKEDRQVQHDALEQASLGLMRGNRINQGLMRRNRVKGANADPVLAVHDYFAASARNRAQARFMPDINRALDEMRDHARNTQDADTWKRGLLIRQAEERALNFGKDGFTGQMPNALQNLSTLAFVKYMMAPIHYALDLTHPDIISIPQIAGRHGYAKTRLMYHKTLGDMGGRLPVLLKGGKGMWEAARKTGRMPTDFAGMIRARLEKNKATPDELRAFDQALETGALHSILMDFRPHFEKTGNLDRALQRAQNVGQEMSSAVDAINRIATYLTAYRLERSRMIGPPQPGSFAHHAQAIRYAKDTVTQTQGLHTPSNRAAMLRIPAVRAAMQFRSVPMMIYKVMARNIYDMYKPETPEVRWAAVRSFVSTMGATALLAGGPAGVPEPVRLAIMLTHALGLTGSWEDLEDAVRREADNSLGKMGGRVVMDGVLGAAGLSAGNRLGLSDLFIKGNPQSSKDFIFQLMGAQAGYAKDEITGINQILHGDLQHGLPAGIPIRFFSDVAKAYYDNQEGKPGRGATPSMQPLDPFETFIRGMGGTPTREANYYKMTNLIREEKTDKQAAMQSVEGRLKWNAAHPHDRISASQVKKATQTGKPDTAKQRQTAEDYRAYQ